MRVPTLTVTSRGQVTFRKEILDHLGLKPGDQLELDLLPHGRASLRSARPTGRIEDFFGFLEHDTNVKATIEEINDAAARGWAGLVK